MSTREERRHEMATLISDAMRTAEGVDWSIENPKTIAAQAELEDSWAQYVEGTTTKRAVRDQYKQYRDLHKKGGVS